MQIAQNVETSLEKGKTRRSTKKSRTKSETAPTAAKMHKVLTMKLCDLLGIVWLNFLPGWSYI